MTTAEQTRAVAHLPGLDIEIVHRPPAADGGETIGVMLRANPSFDALLGSPAFAPLLLSSGLPANPFFAPLMNPLAFNPFLMWAELSQAAWRAWLGAFALPKR
jgi:hypothetical protein